MGDDALAGDCTVMLAPRIQLSSGNHVDGSTSTPTAGSGADAEQRL